MTVRRLSRRVFLILYPGLSSPIDSIVALVAGDDSAIVVDSGAGFESSITALTVGVAEAYSIIGKRLPIEMVVNTHGHVTNAGGDYWFHEELGSIIAAREPDSRWIETGDPVKTAAAEFGVVFRGVPVGLVIREDPFTIVSSGEVRVETIHTPGHTPGSQSVIVEDESRRILLVGDSLGRLSSRWDSCEKDWYRSLERIREARPHVLCTSAICYEGEAVAEFLDKVEEAGPQWV